MIQATKSAGKASNAITVAVNMPQTVNGIRISVIPRVRALLLESQQSDGSWPGWGEERINGPAKCYSTAMASITLEVYMHYLPAYQR